MGSWTTIIVIVIALWGVVSQVIESAARKAKEKKRIEEMRERAAREAGATVQKPGQAQATFVMQPQESEGGHPGHEAATHRGSIMGKAVPLVSRAGQLHVTQAKTGPVSGGDADLAARRRAQLEQLRQRRGATGGQPGPGSVAGRTGSFGQQPAPPSAPKSPFQPPRRPKPVKQPVARSQQAVTRSGRPIQPAPRQPAGAQQASRTVQDVVAAMQTRQQEPRDAYSMPTVPASLGGSSTKAAAADQRANVSALQKLLGDPASLRQIFLAKELLDPPVSLRNDAEPGYLPG